MRVNVAPEVDALPLLASTRAGPVFPALEAALSNAAAVLAAFDVANGSTMDEDEVPSEGARDVTLPPLYKLLKGAFTRSDDQ